MSTNNKPINSWLSRKFGIIVVAGVLTIAATSVGIARTPNADDGGSGQVLGVAFDGHQVSNLENTIKFYEQLDFHVKSKTDWHVDKMLNKLGNTPGAETRQAVMETLSSVSDKPFDIIFTEYRGIDRKNWSTLGLGDLLSGHLDLTVNDDCQIDMDKLKAIGMLKEVQMNMPGGGGGANGPRRFAFVQDPDGWFVEFFAIMKPKPGAPPEGPKVSNSSATGQNIDRLGKQIGFNHIGLDVKDMAKAVGFYEGVLGGDYPPLAPPPPPAGAAPGNRAAPRMNMMNGWFRQAGTDHNVRLELIGEPGTNVPDEHLQDINVNYVGFEVTDIDAVYAKAKADGAITVTDGGIMKVKDGRAVIVRDPDVGGFVELWQPSKSAD